MPPSSPTPLADAAPAAAASSPAVTRALVDDGSLAIRVAPEVWAAVEPWLPRLPPREPAPGQARAWIGVEPGPSPWPRPDRAADVEMRTLGVWIRPGAGVLLRDPGEMMAACVEPHALRATVRVNAPPGTPGLAAAVYDALTLPAALLLGRLGRTLVHAGAVVAPDGRAWLLAGATFSGKSTTCVNLIRAGWDWLADDHVVLRPAGDGGVEVEGWPRRFNLDHGYHAGASAGVRGRMDPFALGPGRWRPSAPLAGLLYTRVEAGRPTALAPLAPADALGRLLDQSPWLLTDPGAAPAVLELLQRTARTPAYEMRLGVDCYTDFDRLQHTLEAAIRPADAPPGAPPERNPAPGA